MLDLSGGLKESLKEWMEVDPSQKCDTCGEDIQDATSKIHKLPSTLLIFIDPETRTETPSYPLVLDLSDMMVSNKKGTCVHLQGLVHITGGTYKTVTKRGDKWMQSAKGEPMSGVSGVTDLKPVMLLYKK